MSSRIMTSVLLMVAVCAYAVFAYAKLKDINSDEIQCKKLTKILKTEKALKINGKVYATSEEACIKAIGVKRGEAIMAEGFELSKGNSLCLLKYGCEAGRE